MKFSVNLHTCTEGLAYPIPFIEDGSFLRITRAAERDGYHSVWGNDHISTQLYVRKKSEFHPRYFDPLVTLGYIAAQTEKIRLGIGVIVLPLRHPVILAKQIATLDVLSKGRLEVAVGVGAYREEFESMYPNSKDFHRGDMTDEGIQCLLTLFKDSQSSFDGKYFGFREMEAYPKPIQDPFPLMMGGNHKSHIYRTARWGQGWLPAVLRPDELKQNVDMLYEEASHCGRENIPFEIAPQYIVCIGKTHEEAEARFTASNLYTHLATLDQSTLKDRVNDLLDRNIIGSIDEVIERISVLEQAGMTHCAAMVFPSSCITEYIDQMDEFAEFIMYKFK